MLRTAVTLKFKMCLIFFFNFFFIHGINHTTYSTFLLTPLAYNTNTYTTCNTICLLTLLTILILTLLTILTKIIRSLTLLTNLAQRKSNLFFTVIIFYLHLHLQFFKKNIRTVALGSYTMTVSRLSLHSLKQYTRTHARTHYRY